MGPTRWRAPEGQVTSIHFASLDLPQTEQEPPVGLSHEAASAREDPGLDTQRSLHPDLGAESILAALRPLQLDADEALVLAHVVAEQEMTFALDGGEKDVQVAVVVQVDGNGRASVGDGVDARDA